MNQKDRSQPFSKDSDEFIDLLKHEFQKRKQKNPKFSLRSFARWLNVNPSYLSKIMRYQRIPSEEMKARLRKMISRKIY